MKKISVLIAFFTFLTGFSQDYTGALNSVNQDGLHTFLLTPEIRSAANENLSYLRIKDAKLNENPYVLVYNTDKTFSTFTPIKVLSKQILKDTVTSIIIENKTGKIQEELTLKIANTRLSKRYTVYGSNTQKNWFGLVADKSLASLNSGNKTFVEKTIYFPINTYKFLKIDFNDKNSLPINVLEVGSYSSKLFAQSPVEITAFTQEDKEVKEKKVTRFKFTSENNHKINVISFKINTAFFLRKVKVIVKRSRKVKKRVNFYEEVIADFQLNSKNKNSFKVHNLNEKEFWIEIDNQDNPALKIEDVQLFQKPIYLVANFKKQEQYDLIIDKELKKPSYDLGNFISSNSKTVGEIVSSNFSKIKSKAAPLKKISFWQTATFMWICIVLCGIVVVYFALGLLKDINNQESN